jgi:hypothetical protein
MRLTCPACDKILTVTPELRGKKVRCPKCQSPVAVPLLWPGLAPPERDDVPPGSGPRCARCGAGGLKVLPKNIYTRRPGYECPECAARMRPPGSTMTCVVGTVLGGLGMLFGLVMLVVGSFSTQKTKDGVVEGSLEIMVFGFAVVSWALYHWRLPLPLDPPPAPSRTWVWVAVLVGLLALGAGVFGFYYYLHEML